jgi:RecJ-like exonuclease
MIEFCKICGERLIPLDCEWCSGNGFTEEICEECDGDGYDEDGEVCEECDGTGYVETDCDECYGSGENDDQFECNGCGEVYDTADLIEKED